MRSAPRSGIAHVLRHLLFIALTFLLPQAANAQVWPARPVRVVVPSSPGGGLDSLARILTARLTEIWGQPIVLDNKPGANFIIGTDAVAKASPDGYTLLYVPSPALTTNPVVISDLPYNPLRDLIPISVLTQSPFVLLVNNDVPAKSIPELLAYLRANPGKLNHGSNSASTRLVSELFKSLAKVEYVEINYKGGAQSAMSTASGETQLSFVDAATSTALSQAGRVRAMAVTTPQRYKLRPDIPTLDEAGVPGYASTGWTVVMAPAKTPADIISKINADLLRVIALPDVTQRIEAVGNEVLGSSPEESLQMLRGETEKWARLVKERNIRFQ